jgi:taurine dioxygenase
MALTSPEPVATWPFEVTPLHPQFGCEIKGVTLEEAVSDSVFPMIYDAFLRYQLILFRDVDLPPATQVALARRFGEVQVHVMNQYHGYADHPEIYVLSNLDENGRPNGKHPDKGTLFCTPTAPGVPRPALPR